MKINTLIFSLVALTASSLHARYVVESVLNVRSISESFVTSNPRLHGKDMSDGLRKHLVDRGYTFAQVTLERKAGKDILVVKEGKMGSTSITGNKHLSNSGIIDYLNWNEGDSFNFGTFQRNTASLNRRNFVEIDTKLSPTRSSNGEVLVNADFTAKDSQPAAGSVNLRGNVGFEDKDDNDYRATISLEYWEPFFNNDRLYGSVTTDPSDPSELHSLGLQYKFGPKELSQIVYGGYFESESKIDVDSSTGALSDLLSLLTPSGKGFHFGYQGSYAIEQDYVDDIGLVYGVTYLDVYSKPDAITPKSQVTLYLPRVGLRGSLKNPGPFGVGRNFWSLSATHDFSTTKDKQLKNQSEAARRGFYYVDLHLTSFQPIVLGIVEGGALVRLGARYTTDVLPNLIKQRIGGGFQGSSGVRGYSENEDSGDRGAVLNLEYRFNEIETALPGLDLKYQPLFFYDIGYVEKLAYTLNNVAYKNTKNDLQSIGAGIIGNFNTDIDFSLNAGVPIKNGVKSKKWDPRINLDLTWKF